MNMKSSIPEPAGQDRVLLKKKPRWVMPVIVVVIVVAGISVAMPAFQRWSASEASIAQQSVQFATVQRGELVRDISSQGRVVAAVKPTLFSPAPGIVSFLVRPGDEVTQGQVLATLDSPEMRNELAQQRSLLERMQVDLDRQRIVAKQSRLTQEKTVDLSRVALTAARREMARADLSREDRLISDIDYQKARDDLERAELDFRHAESEAELNKESLEFELRTLELEVERQALLVADLDRQVASLEVRSPVDGQVGDLQVEQRSAVERNQPMLTVVDLSALEVELAVPEVYADDLGLGLGAEIVIGNERVAGVVSSVSPEIRNDQVSARVRFADGMPPGLRQNQRVTARLLLETRNDVLTLRRGPFFSAGSGRVAYVRRGDFLERTSVELITGSLRDLEVVRGLTEGDVVAISSTDRFDNADRVLLTD